jgi:hypothetical protein
VKVHNRKPQDLLCLRFPRLAALALLVSAGVATAGDGELAYEFFLVESFNPGYPLAETSVLDINNSNIGLGSDTFGAFTWNEADDKIQLPWSGVKSLNNLGWVNYGHVLYHPTTEQQIDVPPPSAGYPVRNLLDINDNMIGVGVATHTGSDCEPFNCPYDCGRAFVWDEANGSRHLDVPDLKALHAVNNHGVAVGVIIVNCDDTRGVVYDLNTEEMINLSDLLPPVEGLGIPAQIWPNDINDAGQVIGLALAGGEPERPFVWTEAEGFTFLPTIPGGEYGYMEVNRINNDGVIVGEALNSSVMEWEAFVWDPTNGIRVLADLVDEPAEFLLEGALAINDANWIVGHGHFGPGWATSRGYVLKPMNADPHPGDLDGTGVVDTADLLAFLAAWGPCPDPPANCPADLDHDGTVGTADLLILLANWG